MGLLKRIFGHCPGYGFGRCQNCRKWFKYPKRRRQSTEYEDRDSNYVICCPECFEEIEAIWAELWAEYDAGRL